MTIDKDAEIEDLLFYKRAFEITNRLSLGTEQNLKIATDFIEELTTLGGKYPEANGTAIVPDAYKVLRLIRSEDDE